MKNVILILGLMLFYLTGCSQGTGTFKDPRDGKVYKTVKIGNQTWFAENLAYKPNSGNYCAYDNDTTNVAKYGYLYGWETAKKVCPTGWHLPTDAEWTTLTDFLGGESISGGKLKETGTTHWGSPNTGATNESGFTALPGGNRNFFGQFQYIGDAGRYWSSTDSTKSSNGRIGDAWFRDIDARDGKIGRDISTEVAGFSVRCIRD
jgi:uncharacterized protein (TIGR02145 family)